MEIKLCIFDLDDTLISTHELYIGAIEFAAKVMSSRGLDYDLAIQTQRKIDAALISEFGVSIDRFPRSLVLTYRTLCKASGKKPSKKVERRISKYGYGVYETKSNRFRGVKTTLANLADHNIQACILTRGNINVQLQRSIDSGVLGNFSQVFVVDKKTPEVFDAICRFYNVAPQETIMIGNSIAGDIVPALDSNLFALYLINGTYELEGAHQISPEGHDRLYTGKTIKDLLPILEKHNDR